MSTHFHLFIIIKKFQIFLIISFTLTLKINLIIDKKRKEFTDKLFASADGSPNSLKYFMTAIWEEYH